MGNIVSHQYLSTQLLECAVCFDEVNEAKMIMLQPCQHKFCKYCVKKLKTCPLCRSDVVQYCWDPLELLTEFYNPIVSFYYIIK